MCGRYGLSRADTVAERFEASHQLELNPDLWQPRFNIAPTQDVLTVGYSKRVGARAVKGMRWGLTQSWSADDRTKPRPINVKSETLLDRPTYRRLLEGKRCLIPADNFYEWQRRGGSAKQPYSIELKSGGLFGFAGIWDAVKTADGWLVSCAILTTSPNELVSQLHDRMPVILQPGDEDLWLDHSVTDPGPLVPLLLPFPEDAMRIYPVPALVNDVRKEGPELRVIQAPSEQPSLLF